jgi:hypothetical protein
VVCCVVLSGGRLGAGGCWHGANLVSVSGAERVQHGRGLLGIAVGERVVVHTKEKGWEQIPVGNVRGETDGG